ncbi:unnamed protein product [Rhizoctonia solani]|uniref:TPR and ankyrin repeat-containing protein 1 n=1 Tax=Rhizoctonia solani TaxID=456999 RepID=A0A8H2X5H8_9AGAM|nr:unnamed protein product [Rhizoctonia solani]
MSVTTSRRWPVILSGRAIREIQQLTKDGRVLDIIRNKVKELSRAQFTTDNQLVIPGTRKYIPIYKARMSVDLRIIYMIDLAADGEGIYDHQVIKIFSVSSRARVTYNFWVKVSKYLARYGGEYRRRCIQRKYVQTTSGQIHIPEAFEHQEYVLARLGTDNLDGDGLIDSETDMKELHETVTRERFQPVTKALYNLILANMEVILPMVLNPDERAIVRNRGTSVVIGRSGTGKTTALIYKMRANAQLAPRAGETRPTRQLFVTRSKVLTQHIAKNYQDLMDSSDIANKTAQELEAMRQTNQKYQNRELVEFDNSVDFRADLPRCFGELEDKHFPLFVSFDKLCELLEADMLAATGDYALAFAGIRTRSIISFSDFKHKYWSRFDTKLTHNLNPALVFSEILGVYKPFSLFELTVNFRSHDGIVRYAASLVELIYTLFPNSIDIMEPELANTPGPPPLLFVGPEDDINQAEFMRHLLDQMPIEHAPDFGLEFDDVLLYNFFAESEAPTSSWKAILSLAVHNDNGRIQFQHKQSEAHLTVLPVLCFELKQLYVAITRARHRCWLWDSGRTIDAMKVFWEGLKLITISESLSPLSKFAASSQDLGQWAQRGQELFSSGLYTLAQSCFERAGQGKEAAIANAYNTMTEAKATQGATAKDALVNAAQKMETCAKTENTPHTAATLWYHAATCWLGATDILHASNAYCLGGFYDQAAVIWFEAQNIDECLRILVSYSDRMDPVLVQKIKEVISAQFLRERRYDPEGRLYEEHRLNFLKLGKSATKRDKLALQLSRGPCLSIVLGLQMLVEELEDYLEHIDDNLMRENLSPKDVAELQRSNKRNQTLIMGYLAKAYECLPPNKPPKITKVHNISGLRVQTKMVWDILMGIKNSRTIPQGYDLKAIELLILRGRDVVLRGCEMFKNPRHEGRWA